MSGTPCCPKRHVPLQLARDGGADAAHALQPLERPEGTVGGAVGDDATGQGRANVRQPFDFGGRRPVDIDDQDRRWRTVTPPSVAGNAGLARARTY